jgi:hypothetical protein
VLRHRKPLDWAPRLSDWGELASALYEYMGWGRDIFRLDYGYVEGGQHDAALESLTGDHILQYLYAEFDDGKEELLKTTKDLWLAVKGRVDLDSRRWFPQSPEKFGKELKLLKQALSHKGFEIMDGTVGTGNAKRKANRIVRSAELGRFGQVQDARTYPDESSIDKPESAHPEGPGQVGQVLSSFSKGDRKKKRRGRGKNSTPRTCPTYPEGKTQDELPANEEKKSGQVEPERTYPEPAQTDPQPTQNGFKRVTRENLETLHQRDTATRQSSSLSIRSLQTCTSTGSIGTANLNR